MEPQQGLVRGYKSLTLGIVEISDPFCRGPSFPTIPWVKAAPKLGLGSWRCSNLLLLQHSENFFSTSRDHEQ